MRSKYATFPEYHTSLDDLSFITPTGLKGGYDVLKQCLMTLENYYYRVPFPCEPQLGRRDLKPSLSLKDSKQPLTMINLLNYLDGEHDLLEVCEHTNNFLIDCIPIIKMLLEEKLLVKKWAV